MYSIQIEIDEARPGVIAVKAVPKTDQNTTDAEQEMGNAVNAVVSKMIISISGAYHKSESQIINAANADKLLQELKDKFMDDPEIGGFPHSRN